MRVRAKPDADIRHFTGFASFTLLLAVFKTLQPSAEKMYTWSQIQRPRKNKKRMGTASFRNAMKNFKLTLFEQFCLILFKLRQFLNYKKLAEEFGISV